MHVRTRMNADMKFQAIALAFTTCDVHNEQTCRLFNYKHVKSTMKKVKIVLNQMFLFYEYKNKKKIKNKLEEK